MRNIWFLLCMMVGGYSGVSVAETMPGKEGEEKIVANVHTQYLDIFSQKQKEKEEDISIHFTADEDMASRSLNEDIYVKAVTQEVVLRQKEALEYMEQGNYDSARKSLRKATLSDAGSRVGLKGSEDLSGNSAMSFQWGELEETNEALYGALRYDFNSSEAKTLRKESAQNIQEQKTQNKSKE